MGNGVGGAPYPNPPGINQAIKDSCESLKYHPEHTHNMDEIERNATRAGRMFLSFGVLIALLIVYVIYYSFNHGN